MATPKPECIDALREAADRLEKSPTKAEYESLGLTPASATIIRQLGGWNTAKEAAGLETKPSTGSRVSGKPDDIKLPDGMEWAELSVDQRWHYRNRERNAERTLERRSELRRWVHKQKQRRGCARCEETTATCLEYHHLNPADKKMNIGEMVTYGYSKSAIRTEMEKCEVLCANCHRLEHATEMEMPLHVWVTERKRARGGCSRCDEQRPVCLDFHHVRGEKEETVSRLVADGRSRETIRQEMAKCDLLCANCHREIHAQSREHDNHK
jgi:hypothetical protein